MDTNNNTPDRKPDGPLFSETKWLTLEEAKTLKTHLIAQVFPRRNEKKLTELESSIETDGQLDPITIIKIDGMCYVIDGRQRLDILIDMVRDVLIREFLGTKEQAARWCAANHYAGRKDSKSQRAMSAAMMWDHVEGPGRKRDALSLLFDVSSTYVENARAVLKSDPALAEQVALGTISIAAAEKAIQKQSLPEGSEDGDRATTVEEDEAPVVPEAGAQPDDDEDSESPREPGREDSACEPDGNAPPVDQPEEGDEQADMLEDDMPPAAAEDTGAPCDTGRDEPPHEHDGIAPSDEPEEDKQEATTVDGVPSSITPEGGMQADGAAGSPPLHEPGREEPSREPENCQQPMAESGCGSASESLWLLREALRMSDEFARKLGLRESGTIMYIRKATEEMEKEIASRTK